MVASDEETLETTLGPDGVLAQASPGAIVFLHATIMPTTTQRIAEVAVKNNVGVLDAPITAIPSVFEAGHGVFLVGGPKELVDAARGHLLQIGEEVLHFGPLGAGNVAKLAKSLINVGERILLAEVLNFAECGGLDLRQFLEMQIATRPGSAVTEWEDNFRIENGHARHRPATNLFNKDVKLAAKMSEKYGLDAPITQGAARTSVKWVESWAKLPKSGA
jgi:3-hydroxyisobutyrate dehydrogenase-like beta-hydroxyacid dehydrogenase